MMICIGSELVNEAGKREGRFADGYHSHLWERGWRSARSGLGRGLRKNDCDKCV